MIIAILVLFTIETLSINIVSLGYDLGVIDSKLLRNFTEKEKEFKLTINDIQYVEDAKSLKIVIFYWIKQIEQEKIYEKLYGNSTNKITNYIENLRRKNHCILYFSIVKFISLTDNNKILTNYDANILPLIDIYEQKCPGKTEQHASALVNYFYSNSEKELIESFFIKISSKKVKYELMINNRLDSYHTEINFNKFELGLISNLEIALCWIKYLLSYKYNLAIQLIDYIFKYLDIRNPDCVTNSIRIEEMAEFYYPHHFEKYKKSSDFISLLKLLITITGRDIPLEILSRLISYLKSIPIVGDYF